MWNQPEKETKSLESLKWFIVSWEPPAAHPIMGQKPRFNHYFFKQVAKNTQTLTRNSIKVQRKVKTKVPQSLG